MTHTTHQALRELDRVAARVEAEGLPFDMGTFGHGAHCGTTACLAGWAMRDAWFAEHGLVPGVEDCFPSYGEETDDWLALKNFFAVIDADVGRLFYNDFTTITDQRAVIASLLATAPDRVVEGGL